MSDHPSPEDYRRLADQYTEIARLAGALAHEIKNPLSTIRLNMELLAEEFTDTESARDRRAAQKIEVVQRECIRLQNLLDDFLNYARVRQLKLEPTDLNEQVRRTIEFFQPKADEEGIEVIPYLESNLPSVMLDREVFQGALLNLVLNAQQAMPDGGPLVISTQGTSRGIMLNLIDRGCGIDEKIRPHIFEAFYSTKRGGSGLGLPMARKIIEAHGGNISVQSEVGKGTKFTIELPVVPRLLSPGS